MNDTVIEPGQTGLFAGLSAGEAVELLQCLDAERADYPKGASIIEEGSRGQGVGILCAGRARRQMGRLRAADHHHPAAKGE